MPETNVVEPVQTPVQTQVAVPESAPAVQEPDFMTKVTQFKKPEVKQETTDNTYKEFEDIKDPVAKDIAIKRDKERQADYTRKTQELAQQRKELEESKKILEQSKNWTPQRIQQELLNNPEFLSAAQQVAATQNPPNSGLTDEQFSALTDKEKAEFASLKSELNQLKQSNIQANLSAVISQKDAQLQSKYSDYNPVVINTAFEELSRMSVADVREYIYKARMHDAHVEAARELGKQEANGLKQDKINAFSPNGTTAISNDGVPVKQRGESDQSFFVRLGQFRLEQSRKK